MPAFSIEKNGHVPSRNILDFPSSVSRHTVLRWERTGYKQPAGKQMVPIGRNFSSINQNGNFSLINVINVHLFCLYTHKCNHIGNAWMSTQCTRT